MAPEMMRRAKSIDELRQAQAAVLLLAYRMTLELEDQLQIRLLALESDVPSVQSVAARDWIVNSLSK